MLSIRVYWLLFLQRFVCVLALVGFRRFEEVVQLSRLNAGSPILQAFNETYQFLHVILAFIFEQLCPCDCFSMVL